MSALLESVESRIAFIQADASLGPGARDKALTRLVEAQQSLLGAQADYLEAESLRSKRLAAPALLADVPASEPDTDLPNVQTLSGSELELRVVEADAGASSARARVADLRLQLSEQREMRLQLPVQVTLARDQLAESRAALAQFRAAATSSGIDDEVGLLAAQAREQAAVARVVLLEERRDGLEVREQLLVAQLAAAEQEVDLRESRLATLRDAREARRQAEASVLDETVSSDLISRLPALARLAEDNRGLLSRQLDPQGTRLLIDETRKSIARLDQILAATETEFSEVRSQVESLGRSIAAGSLVNGMLGDVAALQQELRILAVPPERIDRAQLELVALTRERSILERDRDGGIDRALLEASADNELDEAEARRALNTLLEARLALLGPAIRDLEEYVGLLTGQQSVQDRLADVVASYDQYLRSRQLWLPNVRSIRGGDVWFVLPGLASLASIDMWHGAMLSIVRWVASSPGYASWYGVLFVLVLVAFLRLSRRPTDLGSPEARGVRQVAVFGPALVRAGSGALAIWSLGAILAAPLDSPIGVSALGRALMDISQQVFVALSLRELFRPGGPVALLGDVRPVILDAVHSSAGWYLLLLPVLVLTQLLFTGYLTGTLPHGDLGARVCLLGVMAFSAFFMDRLVRPSVLATRYRGLAYAAAMLVPVVLFSLVLQGYLQASYWLFSALAQTGAILAVAIAVRSFLKRLSTAGGGDNAGDESGLVARRLQLMQVALGVATVGLILWAWGDALVAVSYLQNVVLWTTDAGDGPQSVTLANLVYFAATLTVTAMIVWALPIVFGTRSMDTNDPGVGARYAIASLTKYAVGIVGVLAAFSLLNVGWSKLQWMAAGLSVGLGFGLQETVSNFVAGLILLSERPIRVGDRVSVGAATGTVTRIQIRATTIRDYDGRELIIPNKTLVTSEVSNWTLSNADRRLQLTVGIAYGSDTCLAERLLLQAAGSVEWVLVDPPPRVVFEQFGDDSLQFRLYVWIEGSDHALDSIHELHMMVDRLFRENGIEIAFPQRDVHLDASGPLSVQLVPMPRAEVAP